MDNEFVAKINTAKEWSSGQALKMSEAVDRISAIIDGANVASSPASVMAAIYVHVKAIDDEWSEVTKSLGAATRLLKEKLVPEAFSREGIGSFTSKEGGYRVTVSELVRASMKDKEQCYAWLRDHDLGDLIQETVNASTLAAAARSLMEEGKELDDDLFEVYIAPNTSVTKLKK
jgi:hypothetical protein